MPDLVYEFYKRLQPHRVHLTQKAYKTTGAAKSFEALYGGARKGSTVANIRRHVPK